MREDESGLVRVMSFLQAASRGLFGTSNVDQAARD